ncbi:ferredoxin [Haloechinothrix sp. YIM 98757]|uniref:Ferredoxin n=1 Tax=Haloechinothrix aidingensis TaxID=2752311 RepID=A0A838ACH9_9PSEU|nr:ferredoxin [Haloechinothrix aidingensis]
MRVLVDYDACEANGVCAGLAPEVFELDADDQLHVTGDPPQETFERVRRAVRSCPKRALSLHEVD